MSVWCVASYLLACVLLVSQTNAEEAPGPSAPWQLRYLYVPQEQFELVLKAHPHGQFVPTDRVLDALRAVGRRAGLPGNVAAGILLDSRYEASVHGDRRLALRGELRVGKLSPGWSLVRLPIEGVALRRLLVDGQPWPVWFERGQLALPLQNPGTYRVQIEGDVGLRVVEGNPTAQFRLPVGAASELLLSGLAERRVVVNGRLMDPAEGDRVLTVSLWPSVPTKLVLLPSEQESRRQAVLVARHRIDYRARPDGFDFTVATTLTVYGPGVRTLVYAIPEAAEVTSVEAPQLERWTLERTEAGGRHLRLSFREPLRGDVTLTVHGLVATPLLEPSVTLPYMKLAQAAAQTGILVIHPAAGLQLDVLSTERVRPLSDEERKRHGLAGQSDALAYAFWMSDPVVRLRARVPQAALFAGIASILDVLPQRALLRTSLTIEPRYAPLRQLRFDLPAGWRLETVRLADSRQVRWTVESGEQDRTFVTVTLPEPAVATRPIGLVVEASRRLDAGNGGTSFDLPQVRLHRVLAFEGSLTVRAHADLSLRVRPAAGLEPVPAGAVRGAAAHGGALRAVQAFRYTGEFQARVDVAPRRARLSADWTILTRPEPDYVAVQGILAVRNRGAGLDRLTLTLPQAARAAFHIETLDSQPVIAERRWTTLDPQRVQLTVTFTAPLRGEARFRFRTAVRPVEQGPEKQANVPLPSLQQAERQQRLVVVAAHPELTVGWQVRGLAKRHAASITLPEELPREEQIVAAFIGSGADNSLTLSLRSHAPEPLAGALCRSLRLLTTVVPDGPMRHYATIELSAPARQFLTVTLPDQAHLTAVHVNGQAVVVRRSQQGVAVPLQRAGHDGRYTVELFYETPASAITYVGNTQLLAPRLDVPVAQTRWTVEHAPWFEIVNVGGDMRVDTPPESPSLIYRLLGSNRRQLLLAQLALLFYGLALVTGALVAGVSRATVEKKPASRLTRYMAVVLVVVLLSGVVISLLLGTARVMSAGSYCVPQLRQLARALDAYHDEHGRYPPAAIGPHNVPLDRQFSWIVALLPYLDRQDLYNRLRLDLPVDHPLNQAVLADRMLGVLWCPKDPLDMGTSFQAVVGVGYATSESGRGVFGWERSLARDEVTDPPGTTAMLIEARSEGPWYVATKAAVALPLSPNALGLESQHHRVLMADGSIVALRPDDTDFWRRLATARAGDGPLPDELQQHAISPPSRVPEWNEARFHPVPEGAEARSEAGAEVVQAAPSEEAAQPSLQVTNKAKERAKPRARPTKAGKRTATKADTAQREAFRTPGGARLSLRPESVSRGWPSVSFHSVTQPGEVTVGLRDRRAATVLATLVALAIAATAWVFRERALWRNFVRAILLLAASTSIAALVPAAVAPIADGAALGAVALLACLVVRAVVVGVRQWLPPRSAQSSASVGLALLALLLAASPAQAEDETERSAQPADVKPLTVFVPYDPEKGTPQRPPEVVYVPAETLKLLGLAQPDPVPPAPVPLATVSSMDVTGTVREGRVEVTFEVTVVSVTERPALAVLPLAPVPFREATTLSGSPVRLTRTTTDRDLGGPRARSGLIVDAHGVHRFRLKTSLPIQGDASVGEFVLPVLDVPAGRVELTLPGAELDVTADGLAANMDVARVDGRTRVTAALGGAHQVRFRWRPRLPTTESVSVVLRRRVLVDVHDSGVHVYEQLQYELHNGTTDRLRLSVPEGLVLLELTGPDVAGWELDRERGTVEVRLKRAISDRTTIDLHALDPTAPIEGRFELRLARATMAQRQDGTIVIGCARQFRVDLLNADGLTRIPRDAAVVPGPGPHPGCAALGAYRFAGTDWTLALRLERYSAQRTVTSQITAHVGRYRVELKARYAVQIERAPVTLLNVRVPGELEVLSVEVDAPGAQWILDRDANMLRINLARPAVGTVSISLRGSIAVPASGKLTLVVPEVDAEQQTGTLLLIPSPDCRMQVNLPRGVVPLPAAAGTRPRTALFVQPSPAATVAARYHGSLGPVELTVRDPQPRVTARVVSVADVAERWLEFASSVELMITGGALWELRLETPAQLGEDIELQGAEIAERSLVGRTDQTLTWAVRFRRGLSGRYQLTIWQRIELDENQPTTVPWLRLPAVDQAEYMVAVLEAPTVRLELITANSLQEADVDQLPTAIAPDALSRVAWIFRANRPRYTLRVRREPVELAAIPDLEVFLSHLITQLDVTGTYQTEVRLLLRNETRQHVRIVLPEAVTLLGTFVDGHPVPAVRPTRGPGILIPIPPAQLDEPLQFVQLVYRGNTGERLTVRTSVQLPAPELPDDVPVGRTLWAVLLPDGFKARLRTDQSNLRLVDEDEAALSTMLARLHALSRATLAAQRAGTVPESVVERWQAELAELRRWQETRLGGLLAGKMREYHPVVSELFREYRSGAARVEKMVEDIRQRMPKQLAGQGADKYFRSYPAFGADGKQPASQRPSSELAELQEMAVTALEQEEQRRPQQRAAQPQQPADKTPAPAARQVRQRTVTARLGIGLPPVSLRERVQFAKEAGKPRLVLVITDYRIVRTFAPRLAFALAVLVVGVAAGRLFRYWADQRHTVRWLMATAFACLVVGLVTEPMSPMASVLLLLTGAGCAALGIYAWLRHSASVTSAASNSAGESSL